MCGRFTLKSPRRIKIPGVDPFAIDSLVPRYNIAPTQSVLTIMQREANREATFLQWGLIPRWSKEAKGFINAREETIEEKRSFSESFERRRCLIPADGFYEWQRTGKMAQPYYFQLKHEAPFAFAGIWDQWAWDGQSITSCAVITTQANEVLAPIHNRMPVILHPHLYDLWLSDNSRPSDLKSLLMPFPASEMTSHAVSYDVNHAKIDNENLVLPVEPNVGVNYRLF